MSLRLPYTGRQARETKRDPRLCYMCYKKGDNRCQFSEGKAKCTYCEDLKDEESALIRCSRAEKHRLSTWPAHEAAAWRARRAAEAAQAAAAAASASGQQ